MPITPCPSCQQQLEVPAEVPGGMVACPYCGHEFPVAQRVAPARGGAMRPRRGGARRPRRRQDEGYYDEEGGARGYHQRRRDPTVLIGGVVAVMILVGAGVFFLVSSLAEKSEKREERRLAAVNVPEATLNGTPRQHDPYGDPITLGNIFKEGDYVTVVHFGRSERVGVTEYGKKRQTLHTFLAKYETEEHGERIVSVEGGRPHHVGTYQITSLVTGPPQNVVIKGRVPIDAEFRTDGRGGVVPGSFRQTGGQPLPVSPDFFCERGFDFLPTHPVKADEIWGTNKLVNPVAPYIRIDGRKMEEILGRPAPQGGWYISGAELIKREDGRWTHTAKVDMTLFALANFPWRNFTYQGKPAQISGHVLWEGKATVTLEKQILTEIRGLSVTCKVRVRTNETYYTWVGASKTDYQIYKDP